MVEQYYQEILSKCSNAIGSLSADLEKRQQFVAAHNQASRLEELETLLGDRPEGEMFRLACLEYQYALSFAVSGQYRQAHVSLRLFLELGLSCVLFSAHEVHCRMWLNGQKDVNWSAIVSKDNGVFSKEFVRAFFNGMDEHSLQYCALAETLYRECSEFVHGNRNSYTHIDSEISYNADLLSGWADRADTAVRVVLFAFVCRYLAVASPIARHGVEQLALESFGELAPVQGVYAEAIHV
jgi:hypothetical protein